MAWQVPQCSSLHGTPFTDPYPFWLLTIVAPPPAGGTGMTGAAPPPEPLTQTPSKRVDHQRRCGEGHSKSENHHTALHSQHLSSPNLSPDPAQPNLRTAILRPQTLFSVISELFAVRRDPSADICLDLR